MNRIDTQKPGAMVAPEVYACAGEKKDTRCTNSRYGAIPYQTRRSDDMITDEGAQLAREEALKVCKLCPRHDEQPEVIMRPNDTLSVECPDGHQILAVRCEQSLKIIEEYNRVVKENLRAKQRRGRTLVWQDVMGFALLIPAIWLIVQVIRTIFF